MRRVITGDNAQGESVIIIDGGPSSKKGNPDLGEMFEIWEDATFGPLTPKTNEDRGATRPVLGPRKGNFQVRWFVVHPQPDSAPKLQADPSMSERFAEFYGADHIIDQTASPRLRRRAERRNFIRRPTIRFGARAAHQHRSLTVAQAVSLEEGFDRLLVVEDGVCACPVRTP
jgi:hypothetical protein